MPNVDLILICVNL